MNRFGDLDCSFKRLPPVYGFHSQELVSIEKALEPIESQIKELSRYVKTAKEYCHYPNEHNLSKDQSASVYIYTMEWGETTLYRVLNQALRSENRQALKIWFPYLKLFDTALDLLPTVKESVWRGIALDIGKTFTKNQVFTWWSVNSCSSSVDVIEGFLSNVKNTTLFLIEAVNGKKISGYTEYENEDEIILKMGTQFRVKANPLKRPDGSHIVHLIEIDDKDNDDQSLATAMKSLDVIPKSSNQSNIQHIQLKRNLKWKQFAITIAIGNGEGHQPNRLNGPQGIYFDDGQQTIYIADYENHRIVKSKFGTNNGQIIAGGNGEGKRIDQLSRPTDVIVDQKTKSLIISDYGNRRVVRWSMENQEDRQIIISDICCYGLRMNNTGDLFVSDCENHEVKRWKKGEKEGTIVAGGNGRGDQLNQLNNPTYIFIDRNDTVYVSNYFNHRVMKWVKGAKEGIVVAGGQGQGNSLQLLSRPMGVIVNDVDDVYVADCENHRIIYWSSGSKEGRVVVGGNGKGQGSNQLNSPIGLLFDRENNLYVADCVNDRIQRFDIDQN